MQKQLFRRTSTPRVSSPGGHLATGAIAGQIAGLVMAVVMVAVFTVSLGKGAAHLVFGLGLAFFPWVHAKLDQLHGV
jgi:hypothetical protein